MFKAFLSDERGTEVVEWGITGGLIVAGLVLVVAAIGSWTNDQLTNLNEDLQSTNP
jgi:Flp pilus assembly pilin Flp